MPGKSSARRKRVVILGSTGSIGTSALKVARDIPERMEVIALAANKQVDVLLEQAREFKPKAVAISDESQFAKLKKECPTGIASYSGEEGLIKLATLPEADMVLISIVGTAGLAPALAAIRAGKDLAVASKEILVMAGEEVTREAKKHGVKILPVDSEHNAIFQCLQGEGVDPARPQRLRLGPAVGDQALESALALVRAVRRGVRRGPPPRSSRSGT